MIFAEKTPSTPIQNPQGPVCDDTFNNNRVLPTNDREDLSPGGEEKSTLPTLNLEFNNKIIRFADGKNISLLELKLMAIKRVKPNATMLVYKKTDDGYHRLLEPSSTQPKSNLVDAILIDPKVTHKIVAYDLRREEIARINNFFDLIDQLQRPIANPDQIFEFEKDEFFTACAQQLLAM